MNAAASAGFSRKQTIACWVIGVVSLIVLPITMLFFTPLSYLYCCMRENAWLSAQDQKQLESRIVAPHEQAEISPSQSSWGRDHQMKSGQRMVQYLIFGKEPLDVVYNSDDSIDTIFTSYE